MCMYTYGPFPSSLLFLACPNLGGVLWFLRGSALVFKQTWPNWQEATGQKNPKKKEHTVLTQKSPYSAHLFPTQICSTIHTNYYYTTNTCWNRIRNSSRYSLVIGIVSLDFPIRPLDPSTWCASLLRVVMPPSSLAYPLLIYRYTLDLKYFALYEYLHYPA
jgi:hypothetical protein